MKQVLVISTLLNVVLIGALSWQALRVASAAPGEGGAPLGNGDVNGDGAYNLSDAVYLLGWLFKGGPAPTSIASEAPRELPSTGQDKCYEPDGSVVDCAKATCSGQDGAYEAGCSSLDRYLDNGDGTVTDTCTGLMWQKQTADVNGNGRLDEEDQATSCQALAYCEGLTLAGHDDWRLPNVLELVSIADYSRNWPAINPVFESSTGNTCYMTSTTLRGGPGPGIFVVDFGIGLVGGGGGILCHVRAVRNSALR